MRHLGLIMIFVLAAGLAWSVQPCQGQNTTSSLALSVLSVEKGHSRLVEFPEPMKRVSVANEKVVDVLVISPKQLYVNGKEIGSTNITVWNKKEAIISTFEVRVGRDLTRLKESLDRVMPNEKIEVHELEGAVLLSGQVSSPAAKIRAEAVAKTFEKERVSNLLDVGGNHQVMLKLRFAEVSRSGLKRFNINLGYFNEFGGYFFTFLNELVTPADTEIGLQSFTTGLDFSQRMSAMTGWQGGGGRYMAFIDILKENGLARILAEPNLVCISGKKASFLAGGEFPIPVPGQNYTTIEFKKYGVQLDFLPTVLPDGRIRLEVSPEVSELDYTAALATGGYTVPGLTTRRATTEVELDNGQGFAIAGLLKRYSVQTVSKFPFLGDIPILGALFRSTEYTNSETDLLIVVTPRIVQPGEPAPESLPTDGFIEPSEFSQWLLGGMAEKAEPQAGGTPRRLLQLEGEFGHEIRY